MSIARGKNRQFMKELFVSPAWINWLAPIAMLFYAIVSMGCLNSKVLVKLYFAAISPSAGTVVRVGYFGVCIQTPEHQSSWACSRFIKGNKGLNEKHLALITSAKSMQWNALYPLSAIAACLLFILYAAFLIFRNRSEPKTRYTIFGLWLSCAIAFAGVLIPMMLGQAMHYAAPVYESTVQIEFSVLNIVATWVAFAFHLVYIVAAVWWHKKIGGAGRYGAGAYGMDEDEEQQPGQMEMQQRQYQGCPR